MEEGFVRGETIFNWKKINAVSPTVGWAGPASSD